MNLERFCGFNFKDGEVVAVQAEEISTLVDRDMIGCECGYDGLEHAIPVNLFSIVRTWKGIIRNLHGVVSRQVDAYGQPYYIATEVSTLRHRDERYFRLVENELLFNKVVIHYEIVNIMNQFDTLKTLENLVGKRIIATYVDYGNETRFRIGAPIVITKFNIVECPEDFVNRPVPLPANLPVYLPVGRPEHLPEHRPECRPEHRPECRPEHRPECRPEYRPEYRPEHHPDHHQPLVPPLF